MHIGCDRPPSLFISPSACNETWYRPWVSRLGVLLPAHTKGYPHLSLHVPWECVFRNFGRLSAPHFVRLCQELASTPMDSQERVRSRSRLPLLARKLRGVGPATPIAVALATGSQDRGESSLTGKYGGSGEAAGDSTVAVAVYEGVGRVKLQQTDRPQTPPPFPSTMAC